MERSGIRTVSDDFKAKISVSLITKMILLQYDKVLL